MFVAEKLNTTIIIAPLDWGLGHATRCIPIIRHLLQTGCKIIIATEGIQEKLLKTEFPHLEFVHLPGYHIHYTRIKRLFLLNIILQIPKILNAIKKERKWLFTIVKEKNIDGIIADNRYGFFHSSIPSVFITHQLHIKAPFKWIEKIIQKINYRFIQKFNYCWVPDELGEINLAGVLSHPLLLPALPVEYLGGLSRLQTLKLVENRYNILIIISGPEPQRTLLENKMQYELQHFKGKVLLVRGLPGKVESEKSNGNVIIRNHLPANELAKAFNESELIISRSGYTTVMDIVKLKKKAVLIPTPGQTEQEYLAQHLQNQGWCVAVNQENFSLIEILQKVKEFPFRLPDLDMEQYKLTLDTFTNACSKNNLKATFAHK